MNLNSFLFILCGDTFFTAEILNVSDEKLFWCESLVCIDSALFSKSFPNWLSFCLFQASG